MKKVMFLLTIFEIGGASTVARNILNNLDSSRFDAVLLVEKLNSPCQFTDQRIRMIDLGITSKKGLFKKLYNIARHIKSIRQNLNNEAPDVVIGFGAPANCFLLLTSLFKFKKRPKIIITEHSEEMFLKNKTSGLKYNLFRIVYRLLMNCLYWKADYIIAVSKTIAVYLKTLLFMSDPRLKVIYNPVDMDKIKRLCPESGAPGNFQKGPPCIGTVSRLSPEKGVHFLVQGFKELLNKVEARLIIVGDGPERPALEKLTEALSIREKVIFTGYVDNPFKYLVKMDVFVLSSLWEGFPNVVLEAMACRVPVIASDASGGIRETIKNGINGVLIKPGSFSDIAISVYDLLTNKAKREKIIEEAYQTVQEFDISKIRNQYNSLIYS